MSAKRQLDNLAGRKRLLIAEADLNRRLIGAECAHLRSRLGWLKDAGRQLSASGPWLAAGGALAGLLAARRWRKVARWIPTALAGWRWFRRRRAA